MDGIAQAYSQTVTVTVGLPEESQVSQAVSAANDATSAARGDLADASRAQPTATPGDAATDAQKKLVSAYSTLLEKFYSGAISGEMLAADKSLALHLEQALQMESRFFQLLSNIAKLQHETMQGIIGNLRG